MIDGDKDWVYGLQCEGRDLHAGDMVARESQITLIIGNGTTDDLEYYDEEVYGDDSEYDDGGQADEYDDFEPVDLDDIF